MTAVGIAPDVVTRVSPLGIRLWDVVTQTTVSDGPALTVIGPHGPAPVDIAINPSGIFVLSRLPGLAASEAGGGEAPYWASPPVTASCTITVDDALEQFLPCSFTLTAPTKGLVGLPCAAGTWMPSMALLGIPLFSSPARRLAAGLAAIRAEMWDAAAGAPAAYAMLEIDTGTPPVQRGLADAAGRVLVAVAYPPLPTGLRSPPGPQAVNTQTWPLTVTVYYDPGAASSGPPGHPDLCTVLRQPAATVLASGSPPSALTPATLAYGLDLVLTTPGESVLLIHSGAAAVRRVAKSKRKE